MFEYRMNRDDRNIEREQYCYVRRPICPKNQCQSPRLKTLRSRTDPDGTVTRRSLCLACEHIFDVVIEI